MKRRNFIIGVGALSAGGTAAIGTGAFSSAEAERSVSVELADDASGYLAFESTSEYAVVDDGVLELDFGQDLDELGEHVGEDSSYLFGTGNPDKNVFIVKNLGTQPVEVTPEFQQLDFDSDGESTDEDADDRELVIGLGFGTGNEPKEIEPGDDLGAYIAISTGDNPPDSVEGMFEINANEVND